MPIALRPPTANIIHSTFVGALTDAELDAWLAECKRFFSEAKRNRTKYAFVTLTDPSSSMTSRQRTRSAEWTREHSPLLKEACAGNALVLTQALQRGVLTAVLWMVDYPVPIKVFSTEADANEWARSLLASATIAARV